MAKYGIGKDREKPIKDFNKEYFGLNAKNPSAIWYVLMILWVIFLWFLFGNSLLRGELNLLQGLVAGVGIFAITYFFGPIKR